MITDDKGIQVPGIDELSVVFPNEKTWYEVILTLFRKGGQESRDGKNDNVQESDQGKRVPNASVIGVRRVGDLLESFLYEGSNSFDSIDQNLIIGLSIPGGNSMLDVYIDCALKGYGSDEVEQEPSDFIFNRAALGEVFFHKDARIMLVGVMKDIVMEEKEDEFGSTRRKWILISVESIHQRRKCGGVKGNHHEAFLPAYSRMEEQLITVPEDLLMEALVIATRFIATGGKPSLWDEMEKYLKRAEALGDKDTKKRVERIRRLTYSSSRIE